MVAADRAKIDPAILPPSPRAAHFHGLRVYHQLQVWKTLSDKDLEPTKWGWKIAGNKFSPAMTDLPAGPTDL